MAIDPPVTVVALVTTMSVAVLNMVELVKVTLLLPALGPELKLANVPLYVPLVLAPVVAPIAKLANASATSAPLLATVAVYINPATVTVCPLLIAEKVKTDSSLTPATVPVTP